MTIKTVCMFLPCYLFLSIYLTSQGGKTESALLRPLNLDDFIKAKSKVFLWYLIILRTYRQRA